MFMIQNFATNAAHPQRNSWHISEVGYAWAQEIAKFHLKKKKLFQRKKKNIEMSAEEEAFRFELHKPFENTDNRILGAKKQKAVALCKTCENCAIKELSA